MSILPTVLSEMAQSHTIELSLKFRPAQRGSMAVKA